MTPGAHGCTKVCAEDMPHLRTVLVIKFNRINCHGDLTSTIASTFLLSLFMTKTFSSSELQILVGTFTPRTSSTSLQTDIGEGGRGRGDRRNKFNYAWFQASDTVQMRALLYWEVMQWWPVVSDRYFGTAYWSHFQGSRLPDPRRWQRQVVLKCR